MKKAKYLKYILMTILVLMAIILIPNISNAAVEVTRDFYSDDLSMRFSFTGLELDASHEYEYGFTGSSTAQVENWYSVKNFTETTAQVEVMTPNDDMLDVINAGDTGYITIKDNTDDTTVLEPFAIDLKIPYLMVTDTMVLTNGTEYSSGVYGDNWIIVPLRNSSNSEAYYQYEEITDQDIIDKYKELKETDGDFSELQELLKTTNPTSNWNTWKAWDGVGGLEGRGYPTQTIKAPDTGLYYLWIYFQGEDIKDMYGYILVDNLGDEVELESISLPETATVRLGSRLTLTPTYNPSNATNKVVTWSSSNEDVATVDNAGTVTPVSVGSTTITATSQDGEIQATCTVTVAERLSDTDEDNNDETTAPGEIPQTGVGICVTIAIIVFIIVSLFTYLKYRKMKDIK